MKVRGQTALVAYFGRGVWPILFTPFQLRREKTMLPLFLSVRGFRGNAPMCSVLFNVNPAS